MNLAAARQYDQRQGHLQVPGKHLETIVIGGEGDDGSISQDQEEQQIKLGAWISNQRSRAATLSPERIEQLSAIGMRWERTRLLAR